MTFDERGRENGCSRGYRDFTLNTGKEDCWDDFGRLLMGIPRIVRSPEAYFNSTLPTLVLIDGMPVINTERLLNYDARRIHYVNIYGGQYIFGSGVYNGILYSIGHHGERYEFSFDVHTNKKGITKMRANPVRIVYISDSSLCITDPDRDGLYYNSYFDRTTQSVVYALTDYEYNNANKHKYSNADIYLYRTERI